MEKFDFTLNIKYADHSSKFWSPKTFTERLFVPEVLSTLPQIRI